MIFFAAVLIYYLRLNPLFAWLQAIWTVPLFLLARHYASVELGLSLTVFAATFVVGWILQLIGHIFEGRRPALVDNFSQIFTAPLFLTHELLSLMKK
jgi:uncharacterized membrane protein YGL010W